MYRTTVILSIPRQHVLLSWSDRQPSITSATTIIILKADWKQSKEEQALLKKKKNELKKTEERITVIEDRLKAIEEESALPEVCTDTARLLELHKESTKLSEELDTLYE